ncbi:hypothetical protein A2757_03025 [Candidatus Giovannonibacteria bacterium RIFCSPHIGHO2_01_FULL_48_47]|nr:MAG: hypothetical protein A2757_03025 [Candidatus Giovannonibacteria bacterium RIFCSPHIGHO2_01_FULL_48_47]OGF68643.1 MAG: hypothetical protein A3D61_00085 [Candidatus Giovannonibacteria bacterium RIFCSPHIGHO2_02_FULL_48_15]OGF88157.1 MAG: hypothetical protein A3B26_00555 [Candidatus Giovannonibacteria bacterium RIFCSPLOWO2_01_FULL_48_47]OGF94623.1 MAG: hypothetical protein A2433_03415 [Candidatus Giovannonibacteria bacterium RIFOXYC1_FULL_48_8]OGF95898.1 MAG: hypothetical protein A2613_03725
MGNFKSNLTIIGVVVIVFLSGLVLWYSPPDFLKPEPVKVQYQVATGGANELRAQVIKKYGLDKKHGVELEIISTDPGELERRISKGESYLAEVSPFTALTAKQNNVELRIISPAVYFNYYLLVSSNSKITSLEELKGGKIGTQPKVTAAYSALAIVLKSAGFDIEKDFSVLFGNIPQTVAAVEKGEADAASASYPSAAAIIAGGKFRSIASLGDLWSKNEDGLSLPFVVLAANGDWFEENRETARRVVETILEGGRFIQEQPQVLSELTDYLNKYNYNTPQITALLEAHIPSMLPASYGEKEVRAFERFFARAKQLKIIPPDAPIESYLVKPEDLGI